MKLKFWSWILAIVAYSFPVLTALAIFRRNANMLWGFLPMVFHFLLFWYLSKNYGGETAGRIGLITAEMAAIFGLLIVMVLVLFPTPYIIWMTLGQFLLSWVVCAMVDD
jgi:hypothetical protein